MTVSLKNIASVFVSFSVALGLLYFGHKGLERELARTDRSLWVLGFYGALVILGLLAAPTIRDRIVGGAQAGIKLARLGRRAYDGQAITNELELPPKADT